MIRAAWCAALALVAAGPAFAGTPTTTERWYAVDLAGEPAGWMVSRSRVDGEEITSESILRLGFRRGATAQTIGIASRFVETAAGRPIRAWSRQELGAVPLEATYVFGVTPGDVVGGDVVEATFVQGESVRSETLPAADGEWLPPAALERAVAAHLAAGEERFTLRTVDPAMGIQPIRVDWARVAARVTIEVGGERHVASRWRQTQSAAPALATIVEVDADGRMLRSETPILGTTMTVTLASREAALAARGTPELLVASFVAPDRPIAHPRRLDRVVYSLGLTGGADEAPVVPSTGAQRAESDGGRAIVTVDLATEEVADAADRGRFLAVTAYLDHDDPRVAELAERALRDLDPEAGDGARAAALHRFVAGYLDQKDLGSILATASEVAVSRSGDCTEHAVLLAALLRSAGIPSRAVTGLVYVERFAGASEIFAYHMWTQALVDGRWVDYDATLERRFDAAHVALATSDLADGSVLAAIGEVAPLIGRLEVSVLETAPRETPH